MAGITIKSKLDVMVGKTPAVGDVLLYKDKLISASYLNQDYSESSGGIFTVLAGAADVALAMGTVATGHLFFLELGGNLEVKLVNSLGVSQKLVFKPNMASLLNIDFTGILVSNPGTEAVTGHYFVVGD